MVRSASSSQGRHRLDRVVLDVTLPEMDGFAVESRVRLGGQSIRVLLLTSRGGVEGCVRI
jgi:DNA-binding response OmpR family regulator